MVNTDEPLFWRFSGPKNFLKVRTVDFSSSFWLKALFMLSIGYFDSSSPQKFRLSSAHLSAGNICKKFLYIIISVRDLDC